MLLPTISASQQTSLTKIITKQRDSSLIMQIRNKLQNGVSTIFIDFANIYLLICSLLITVFMGKPSLSRVAFNLITINTIIYEFKTGEMLPRCSKFYPSLIAMPFLVLGSIMYSKTNSKAMGTMILLMSSLIYYAILIAGVNVNTT